MREVSFWKTIPNGKIPLSSRVSMAIHWFAVGSSYDIAVNHGLYYQKIMKSVWIVVDLVNLCETIKNYFPSIHTEQEKVAEILDSNICIHIFGEHFSQNY